MTELFESFTFIVYLFIGSFYCFGVYKIFDDILVSVRSWFEIRIGTKWCKPLFLCPPCMGSFHGLYLGLIIFGLSWHIPIYCICLCGLTYLINEITAQYE